MGTRHEVAVVLLLSVGSFYSPLFLLSVGPIWPIWWKLLQEFFFFWLQGRVLALVLVVLDTGITWPWSWALGQRQENGHAHCPMYSARPLHLPTSINEIWQFVEYMPKIKVLPTLELVFGGFILKFLFYNKVKLRTRLENEHWDGTKVLGN